MRAELPREISERIAQLSAEGDALATQKKRDEALGRYEEAWALLPAPKTQWEAARWLLAAIGDAHFFSRRFNESLDAFTSAIVDAGGLGNPFLHLRRGESLFELGRTREAADELMRAHMGGGLEIFTPEDPKYLAYLKTVAKL